MPSSSLVFPMQASPQRAPSDRRDTSMAIVATLWYPITFCVSVLRAFRKFSAGRAWSVSWPRCSISDQALLSGLWFHCHCGERVVCSKSSLVCGRCLFSRHFFTNGDMDIGPVASSTSVRRGMGQTATGSPTPLRSTSTPMTGQSSCQCMGWRCTTRPKAPLCWK